MARLANLAPYIDPNLVWYELALVHEVLGLATELCVPREMTPQHVASGYMMIPKILHRDPVIIAYP